MKTHDFNIEYFKFLRLEILQRIDTHFKLILAKFGLTGALFAFLWKGTQPLAVSPFLVASIFAFLFDVVILENLGWIRSAGAYIKENLEEIDLPIVKWEHDFAQSSPRDKWSRFFGPWKCFNPRDYILGTWMVGAALCAGYFSLESLSANSVDLVLFIIDCYFMVYTFILVFFNLAGKPPMVSNKRSSPIIEK